MKKKTIKDEEGYLGMLCVCDHPIPIHLELSFHRSLEKGGLRGGVCVCVL